MAPTDTVTLNANELTFQSVALKGEDGAAATVALDPKLQTASFHFPHDLSAGHHTLEIAYYNDYDTPSGRKRMLVTQFEDTDAREMLPCWDEPSFKATYHLTVVVPKSLAAISNTPIEAETASGTNAKGAELKKVTFGQTPKMSSYLLVLAVGELDKVETKAGGAEISAWAVAGKEQQGRYAMTAAAQILQS